MLIIFLKLPVLPHGLGPLGKRALFVGKLLTDHLRADNINVQQPFVVLPKLLQLSTESVFFVKALDEVFQRLDRVYLARLEDLSSLPISDVNQHIGLGVGALEALSDITPAKEKFFVLLLLVFVLALGEHPVEGSLGLSLLERRVIATLPSHHRRVLEGWGHS